MTFWLVALPLEEASAEEKLRELGKATKELSNNSRFELPMSLRVGGLDKLMELSDDLARIDVHVEGVVNKIRRQANDVTDEPLNVNNRPITSYVTNFSWDEAKYPLRKPLKEIVEDLTESVSAVDDDLKVKIAEYTVTKQQFQAANRKTEGSLAIKDLGSVVPKEAVISTENITTVVVTVPNHGMNDFKVTYETWCDMVVPRSAEQVATDSDYTLMRVLVFRKKLDDFKAAARGKQCQTREYSLAPEVEGEVQTTADEVTEELRGKLAESRTELASWCKTSFGEAFTSWIHICAVRLFVESVLRYGLPPKFLGVLVEPTQQRHETKVRKGLADAMDGQGSMWSETGKGGGEEMYPYVSLTLDLDP